MSKPQVKWKRLGQKTAYKGRMHIVEHEVELPNGERSTYEVDHGAGRAVAVLIKTPDNEIVLTHQFRFPLDKWIYDLPGGGVGFEEEAEAGAIRECQEEVGIQPRKLVKLGMFYPNPGRGDWAAHLYFCDDYEAAELKLDDPSEIVGKVLLPVEEFRKLVRNQEIIDPSLLIAWYTACDRGLIG